MLGKGNYFGITKEERSVRLSRLETTIADAKAEKTRRARWITSMLFTFLHWGKGVGGLGKVV